MQCKSKKHVFNQTLQAKTIFLLHFQRIHVIFPFGRNSPLSVATPSGSPINHPPTTANQSAQTRSVRFDRRRPQTLELRRGSSPSYVGGGCHEVDSYLM